MIWVKVGVLVVNVAFFTMVWRSTKRTNERLAEIDRLWKQQDLGAGYYARMTRPRELTDKDEMLLRHLTRDPRQPFDGSTDDE